MNQLDLFRCLDDRPQVSDVAPAETVTLRPYQRDGVDAVFREWDAGNLATLLVLPTGTGKSVCFADVMRRHDPAMGRILLLAHREELIYQGVSHAKRAGLSVGIEMGQHRARNQDVIVSSIQTQNAVRKCRSCFGEGCGLCDGKGRRRRMTSFRPRDFGLVVIDEAHHAAAKTYLRTTNWYRQNPNVRILLVTATPKRTDNIGLHNVCDSVAYEMDLPTAINDGWLCPIRQTFVTINGLDLSTVTLKRGGDFSDGELEKAILGGVDDPSMKWLHGFCKPTLEIAKGNPVLFVAPGVKAAELFTAAFNAYDNVSAELVIGTTDKRERPQIIDRFRAGETQVLVGVDVFTEGFDAPKTAVVAIAKPVSRKATSRYTQLIGRGTRPLPGVIDGIDTAEERRSAIAESAKPVCTILDFVGNSGRHKIASVADSLAGLDVDDRDVDAAVEAAKSVGEPVDMEELIEMAMAARQEREAASEERRRKRQLAATSHRADRVDYDSTDVDLFNGKGFLDVESYDPSPTGASAKQVNYLIKLGVDRNRAASMTRPQAGKVIDQITKKTGSEWVMQFGKHSGEPLSKVPVGYLSWAAANIQHPAFQANLRAMRRKG